MPTPRRRPPPTRAQRLHAVAAIMGTPPEVAGRVIADIMAADATGPPAAAGLAVTDPALVACLETFADAFGIPPDVLGLLFIRISLEHRETRARGQRWPSTATAPGRRTARRSGRGGPR